MATLPTPGILGSVLGLVGLVSVYCDFVRQQFQAATPILVWQRIQFSKQIHPWGTLCIWLGYEGSKKLQLLQPLKIKLKRLSSITITNINGFNTFMEFWSLTHVNLWLDFICKLWGVHLAIQSFHLSLQAAANRHNGGDTNLMEMHGSSWLTWQAALPYPSDLLQWISWISSPLFSSNGACCDLRKKRKRKNKGMLVLVMCEKISQQWFGI